MSKAYIAASLRRLVEQRANYRCEYCLLPGSVTFFPHEIDHVIAEKHGGKTEPDNLALTCWRCNRHKDSDLGSFDPATEAFCFLFNPRTQAWNVHFFQKPDHEIEGLTPEGRTTARLLKFNTFERIAERQRLAQ